MVCKVRDRLWQAWGLAAFTCSRFCTQMSQVFRWKLDVAMPGLVNTTEAGDCYKYELFLLVLPFSSSLTFLSSHFCSFPPFSFTFFTDRFLHLSEHQVHPQMLTNLATGNTVHICRNFKYLMCALTDQKSTLDVFLNCFTILFYQIRTWQFG